MDLWAVSDTHRFGLWHASQFAIPDEDPPGNQVTPRVEVAPSLMGGNGWPKCSHPGRIPVSLSRQGYTATPLLLHSSNTACTRTPTKCVGPHLHRTAFGAVQVWWWNCRPWGRRARFQALCVAWSGFRQSGVLSSHSPVPRRKHAGHNASRWAAKSKENTVKAK